MKLVYVDDFPLARWKFEKGRLNLIEVQKRIFDLSERRLTLVPVVRLSCPFVFRFEDPEVVALILKPFMVVCRLLRMEVCLTDSLSVTKDLLIELIRKEDSCLVVDLSTGLNTDHVFDPCLEKDSAHRLGVTLHQHDQLDLIWLPLHPPELIEREVIYQALLLKHYFSPGLHLTMTAKVQNLGLSVEARFDTFRRGNQLFESDALPTRLYLFLDGFDFLLVREQLYQLVLILIVSFRKRCRVQIQKQRQRLVVRWRHVELETLLLRTAPYDVVKA